MHPFPASQSDEEDEATEAKLHAHRNPNALQAVSRSEDGSQGDADCPHAEEVHAAWNNGIGGPDKYAIADDSGGEHRFGECLNAQCHHS